MNRVLLPLPLVQLLLPPELLLLGSTDNVASAGQLQQI